MKCVLSFAHQGPIAGWYSGGGPGWVPFAGEECIFRLHFQVRIPANFNGAVEAWKAGHLCRCLCRNCVVPTQIPATRSVSPSTAQMSENPCKDRGLSSFRVVRYFSV